MFKKEDVYEFQTAQIYDGDDLVEFLKEKAKRVKEVCTTSAPAIPVLPDKVSFESLIGSLKGLTNVPIGIERQSLNVSTMDLQNNKINIISSTDLENLIPTMKSIITMINEVKNTKIVLIDLNKIIPDFIDTVTGYCDRNFDVNVEGIIGYVSKNIEKNQTNHLMFVIVGTDKLSTVSSKNALNKIMEKIIPLDNANIIIADSSYQLRKLSTELWYSSNVRGDQGLWVGNGLIDQTAIRLSGGSRIYSEKIDNRFAWKVKNGQGVLVKLMELDKNEK